MLAHDAASAWLGIKIEQLSDGHATLSMTLRAEMMNGFGLTHGGMIFAFADSAFAFACNPSDSDGSSQTVASGVDVNFLAPSYAGQRLIAVANRRAQAGRSGLYDVQVFTQPEHPEGMRQLIAEFRGRSRTIPSKANRPHSPAAEEVR
ncbi:hydroxyphenylacetyl-CoA thioesterase PaaI [Psychromicrobium lacuslunae]|uniref:hydroxyphenylacetyl-CoA thioesterase PaaI n=1 Tax=Psychromicrobium lacuslunae TaxID=1618207 RepID=UPI0005D3E853|nr:hydroxyphenylacetyl-CoA thioesterase PaaI [Psychromicrobium lacuslunae]